VIYSSDKSSPKYEKAKDFRQSAIDKDFVPIISHQNIFESIRVLTHPKFENPMTFKRAIKQINSFKSFCITIYPIYQTDRQAIKLIGKYKLTSNQIFDAYLVSTMLSNGVKIIATDNEKDLGIFEEIDVYNPF
jgi:predicted nucleic acid-binding protein